MTEHAFRRYDLRTTDPDAARRFYEEAVGLRFDETSSPGDSSQLCVWPLHEQARARGAPAHWLGQIEVADVDATVSLLLERGSERLGPTQRAPGGAPFATLRDPFGAVVAVRAAIDHAPRRSPVAWHQLHTTDLARAWDTYAAIFGWVRTETIDVSDPPGGYQLFTWQAGAASIGAMGGTAGRAGVHAHWLFFFPVIDLASALDRVRASGGNALPSVTLPNGDRLAPCHDPQGAAFGICQLG